VEQEVLDRIHRIDRIGERRIIESGGPDRGKQECPYRAECAMNHTTTRASVVSRRVFSLVLLAYFISWLVATVYLSRVFGVGLAPGLSLILIFPFVVGTWMRSRRESVRMRDFVFLSVLLIIAFGAVAYVVWKW
jgi:hypothetical protein